MTRGFAIVGTGVIAATHADAIALLSRTGLPDARLVAITDVDGAAAAAFAAAHGCRAEPDLGALLARRDVEVVCVCVPSGLHAEIAIQAAKAGKHLVVEKPIDVSLEAADRLIDAASAAGVALTVISQHRFDSGLVELKRLIDDGALGRLVLAEATTKWYRTQDYYDSAAWRGTWAMDGGSLANQGVHYVDLLRWCMGPAAEVTAVYSTQAHQIEVEDTALAIVRFASGAVGTILSSTAAFPGFPQRLEITGTQGTVTIEDGQIVRRALITDPGPPALDTAPGASHDAVPAAAESATESAPAALGVASHAAQLADLLAAVDSGREPAVSGQAGRDALEIVCAVYESSRTGRPVKLAPLSWPSEAGPMTVILSGFADEISPDPQTQLATLAAESISHLELRSAWSVNVADFTDAHLAEFRAAVDGAGVRVSAIGSPVGKIPVDAPLGPELDRLRRVADVAASLGAAIVRVFSFYIPAGEPPQRYRGEVIDRMGALARIGEERGLVLAHENEKEIYGDTPDRCADLITTVGSPALQATFDPANFVQCGVLPFSGAYAALRPYLVYLQVKDALAATGEVVPAGQGDGQLRETLAALKDSGFAGFMSLEPHLAQAGRFGGFSGPEGFHRAASALKFLLNEASISWQ